jgi:hypothetical protein
MFIIKKLLAWLSETEPYLVWRDGYKLERLRKIKMAEKTYDWKKTGKKFLWTASEVVVLGLLSYVTSNHTWLYLVPLLEALRNYLKHRK